MPFTAAEFAQTTNVSRETLAAYQVWHDLLVRWNAKINLVSSSTISDFWERHALDSWQITASLPNGDFKAIDLGSGAGFAGIAVAIYAKEIGIGNITFVESAGKKANFLRTLIRELALPAVVLNERAENVSRETYDLVTARAFAPFSPLLSYAQKFWGQSTIGLFHKGENYGEELTQAVKTWHFAHEITPSISHDAGVILKITDLKPAA